jgi:hypothetical protein
MSNPALENKMAEFEKDCFPDSSFEMLLKSTFDMMRAPISL